MPIKPEVIAEYDRLRSEPDSIFGSGLGFLGTFLRSTLFRVVPTVDNAALVRTAANCKPTSSVIEKIDRLTRQCYGIPPGRQVNNLEELKQEIRDLVRGRVVVDCLSEANALSQEIVQAADREKWPWSDKRENLYFADVNGYRAFHITLLVPTPYGHCYCEVQVFTVNQFSWASKTHPLQWKPAIDPPLHLKEIMKHLSDCLHTSDRLFETVKEYMISQAVSRKGNKT